MRALAVTGLALAGLATADAFAPAPSGSLILRSHNLSPPRSGACPPRRATAPRMAAEGAEAAQALLAAVPNVPFVDEISGEPQGLTAPLTHFGSVIALWVLFALPVWSAAYKQAGATGEEWTGVSQVTPDAPGIGQAAKYTPAYDGPTFREGIEYVISFLWKPPILVAWKPRADLDRAAMDPARDTVVSALYKGLGGALDKTAIYDEEDQLLILSEIETFDETPLGRLREAQALASGLQTEDAIFGRSLTEITRVRGKVTEETVNINAAELAALRAAAAGKTSFKSSSPPKPTPRATPAKNAAAPSPSPAPAFKLPSFSLPSLPTPPAPKAAPKKPSGPSPAEIAAKKRAEEAKKQAERQAAAAAAAKQAAAAQAAKGQAAADAAKARGGARMPQVGLGTMPVPKAVNIPFFGKTQKVNAGSAPAPAQEEEEKRGGFSFPNPFGK